MPFQVGKDKDGSYIRWGNSGKKYHFNIKSKRSFNSAYNKARKQALAIIISQYN